jgi:hypothetical protein
MGIPSVAAGWATARLVSPWIPRSVVEERAFAADTHKDLRLKSVEMMETFETSKPATMGHFGVWIVWLLLNLADNKTVWVTRLERLHDPNPCLGSGRREQFCILDNWLELVD